ncbi:MAG TPA: DUF58 domain-containing protein [Opitutaceae bacterium]|jgi:uncharacterized protein (DUF58 family)
MRFAPTSRLVVLLFALAAGAAAFGLYAGPSWGYLGAAVLALIVVADLWRGSRDRVPPASETEQIVRLTELRPSDFVVTHRFAAGARRESFRVAIGFPPELGARVVVQRAANPAEVQRLSWHLCPTKRGRIRGVSIRFEYSSPAGLWLLRYQRELPADFRIYPNLMAEGRGTARHFLPRAAGQRAVRGAGRGREFEKLREYLPGDGFDELHWKASAKRSRPVTKVFQMERTQEVLAVVDASRLSARSSGGRAPDRPVLDRFVPAALALIAVAQRQGDKFGVATFDDRIRAFVGTGSGRVHYGACRDALLELQPSDAVPDVAEIVRFLRTRVRRRTLMFLFTDLSDPVLAEDLLRYGRLLTPPHRVFIGQAHTSEVAPLFGGAPVRADDEVYARLAGHLRWKELRAVARRLRPSGVTVVPLHSATMASDAIQHYLAARRKMV